MDQEVDMEQQRDTAAESPERSWLRRYATAFREFAGEHGAVRALAKTASVLLTEAFSLPRNPPLPPEWKLYWQIQSRLSADLRREDPAGMEALAAELDRSHSGTTIAYVSPLPWSVPLFQRPHQLLRALARRGSTCLFVTPRPEEDRVDGWRRVEDNLFLVQDASLLRAVPEDDLVLYVSWTPTVVCVDALPGARIVYDWMDELPVFDPYCELMVLDHLRLLHQAQWVTASSSALAEQAKQVRGDVVLVPNAACVEDFDVPRGECPGDLEPVVRGGVSVAGFVGALDAWRMDYGLVEACCEARPDVQFVLIGPSYDNSATTLGTHSNLHLLGPKPYEQLPSYVSWLDVGLIPYKVDRLTRAVFPVKLFEYLAAGKPVVCTDLPDCRQVPGVITATSTEAFVDGIRAALTTADDEDRREERRQAARRNSWDERARVVEPLLAGRESSTLISGHAAAMGEVVAGVSRSLRVRFDTATSHTQGSSS